MGMFGWGYHRGCQKGHVDACSDNVLEPMQCCIFMGCSGEALFGMGCSGETMSRCGLHSELHVVRRGQYIRCFFMPVMGRPCWLAVCLCNAIWYVVMQVWRVLSSQDVFNWACCVCVYARVV